MTSQPDRPVEWWEAWDHQVHAFTALGEIASTAACGRIVATMHLSERPRFPRWCGACLLIWEPDHRIAWPQWDTDQIGEERRAQ